MDCSCDEVLAALGRTREEASREGLKRPNTQRMARIALAQLLPAFGPKLLCDLDPHSIQDYQQRRLAQKAQGRTINIEVGVLRQVLKANECWQPLEGRVKMLRERKDIGRALSPDEEVARSRQRH